MISAMVFSFVVSLLHGRCIDVCFIQTMVDTGSMAILMENVMKNPGIWCTAYSSFKQTRMQIDLPPSLSVMFCQDLDQFCGHWPCLIHTYIILHLYVYIHKYIYIHVYVYFYGDRSKGLCKEF